MTEVPEHLLARSRERRAALGLGGGAAPPAGDALAPAAASASPPATIEQAGAPVPAAAAAAPAIVEPEKPPVPAYLRPEARKANIPTWVLPVLVFLPFWGILYIGAFGSRDHAEALTGVELGAQVFRGNCATCHGAQGEGGVGPKLAEGEAALTFPEEADHIAWVKSGSGPKKGQFYGAEDREGGQKGPATGGMPAFSNLSDEQVEAVVLYEREEL